MDVKKNRIKLRGLMSYYDVKGPEVAELVGRKAGTVNKWMSESGADIPDETIFFLEHLLKLQTAKTA